MASVNHIQSTILQYVIDIIITIIIGMEQTSCMCVFARNLATIVSEILQISERNKIDYFLSQSKNNIVLLRYDGEIYLFTFRALFHICMNVYLMTWTKQQQHHKITSCCFPDSCKTFHILIPSLSLFASFNHWQQITQHIMQFTISFNNDIRQIRQIGCLVHQPKPK